MVCRDVHFLMLHEPYTSPEHPVPINATIVHAASLLHVQVPQPDGGRMYRCLTEFPGRTAGCVVPLSTITFELDGGRRWPDVADWEEVVEALVQLSRDRKCDALPIGLPHVAGALLAGGPTSTLRLQHPDGRLELIGPTERQHQLMELESRLRSVVAEAPFWPGEQLVKPPAHPVRLPYQPYDGVWRPLT